MLDIRGAIALAFGFQFDLVLVQAVQSDGCRYEIRFKVLSVRYIASLYIVGDKVTSAVLFIDR